MGNPDEQKELNVQEALNEENSLNSSVPLNSSTQMQSPKLDNLPRVAAIVVTHNGAGTIQTCIESLLGSQINPDHRMDVHGAEDSLSHSLSGNAVAQPKTTNVSPLATGEESQPLRVIVVDNASTDETPRILNQYALAGHIEVIRLQSNVGFGAGNNTGIRRALEEGVEYCFLLNQDAFVESDTIARLVGVMEEHTEIGVLSPLHMNGDGDDLEWHFVEYGLKTTKEGRKWLEEEWPQMRGGWFFGGESPTDTQKNKPTESQMHTPTESPMYIPTESPFPVDFVNAAAWMVRQSCFEEAGGFHPAFFMYSEDVEFLQRVHSLGLNVSVAPNCAVLHDRSNNEQRERRGAGLKNDPLRVHTGAVLSIALQPGVDVRAKSKAIRSRTLRFVARSVRRGDLSNALKGWDATSKARNLMNSNVFEDAKRVLFSS